MGQFRPYNKKVYPKLVAMEHMIRLSVYPLAPNNSWTCACVPFEGTLFGVGTYKDEFKGIQQILGGPQF